MIFVAITSQVPDDIMELEIIVGPAKGTGLLKKSLVRLDFIMTIPENLISRKIGQLPDDMLRQTESRIKKISCNQRTSITSDQPQTCWIAL